jgi:hypothetical protein
MKSTDPEGWDEDKHVYVKYPTDAVIWEVHVGDFSGSPSSGVSPEHRGKYLAFTEKGTTVNGEGKRPTCLDYLIKLGVTHVHLNPVYDFDSVDEASGEGLWTPVIDELKSFAEGGQATGSTDKGWLMIYHGVTGTCNGSVYSMGAAILDRDEPTRVLHRSSRYILTPEE